MIHDVHVFDPNPSKKSEKKKIKIETFCFDN